MDKLSPDYETDFYAWLIYNAQLLRQGRFSEVDKDSIAEELESMGRREKRQLISRLAVLIAHLLKWVYQPEKRSYSWECTIREQRKKVVYVLQDSPSLKHGIDEKLQDAYEMAVLKAAQETHIRIDAFPTHCPFSLTQIMDDDFYPDKFIDQ